MANNHAQGTFNPFIPAHLLTAKDQELCDALGVTLESCEVERQSCFYLFNSDYATSGFITLEDGSEKEVGESDLYDMLQDVIKRSNGALKFIHHEQAYTCDRMRPGEFGGSAVFITADDIRYHGTSTWLEQRISEIETGNFMVDAEDDDCTAPTNPDFPRSTWRQEVAEDNTVLGYREWVMHQVESASTDPNN